MNQYMPFGYRNPIYPLSYYLALIEDARDQNKFEYLYNTYHKQMYYAAYRILKDSQYAEDAVHEAFLRLARNISKVDDETSKETKNFVMLITSCAAKDIYRKRQKQFDCEVYAGVSDEDDDRDFIEQHAATTEFPEPPDFQGTDVAKALQTLSPDIREILLLHFGLGYSRKEVSEITGFSVHKIDKSISRGKQMLAKKLETVK